MVTILSHLENDGYYSINIRQKDSTVYNLIQCCQLLEIFSSEIFGAERRGTVRRGSRARFGAARKLNG